MDCADRAESLERGAESAVGAMEPYSQSVSRDAEAARDAIAGLAEEVHAPENMGVVARERRQQPIEALAHGAFGVVIDQHGPLICLYETLVEPLPYSGLSVVVGKGPAQHLREPRAQSSAAPDGRDPAEHFQIEVLQDVFGVGPSRRASSQEAKELSVALAERGSGEIGARLRGLIVPQSVALSARAPSGPAPRGL